ERQQFERAIPRPNGVGSRHSLANYLPDLVNGEVRGFYVIVHDITDIVESRQAFARERERLAHIIEGTNVGTWEWNVHTGEIAVNERWAGIIGYTLGELQLTHIDTWKARCHPDDLPMAQGLLETHFRGEQPQYQSVVRMRHKAGHWVWVQSRGRVVTRMPHGEPQWMYGTHQDITAMKQAEEHLQQVVATLEGVLGAATEQSIIATDLEGTITLFNTGAEKMLGYQAHDMVGTSSPAPLHLAKEVEAYGQALSLRYGYPIEGFQVFVHEAEQQGFENREWTYVHKDGHHLPVQLSVNTIRDAQGGVLGYLGIAQDLTERNRQDQILRQAKAAAETASAAKSMFLANMSHEIRTPMNAVLGVAHLLADTPLDDDQRQLLSKLQIAGRSLLGIINDVLDISKIEAGEMTTESVNFRPAELLSELIELYSPQAAQKSVTVALQGLEHVPVPVALQGDPTRLRQVLSNLLSNSIKFTSQGSVSLQVTREQSTAPADPRVWLQFSVVDTGEGISETALKGLFTPFAQADASTTRRFGGTGLGLSIVKRLCQLMGGDVGVHSALGVGSTFWVRLPFAMVDEAALSVQAASSQDRLSICIVDDSDVDRAALTQLCQAFGWRTTALSSGTELVHRLQEMSDAHQPLPDALIVDWQMPSVDGIQALTLLSERLGMPHLPATLVVSAYERDLVASHDHAGIAGRILTKPVNSSALFNAVNAIVAEHTGRLDQVMASTRLDSMRGRWLQGLRILLVDDSDINLEVASRLLIKEGATVQVCVNGQEALDALRAMQPSGVAFDAVLMDVQMPVLDGYGATQRARQELGLKNLPIIALTAGALTEERRRAEAAGMNAFLTKPLDPALLIRTVHAQVTQARGAPIEVVVAPQSAPDPHTVTGWPAIEGIQTEVAIRLLQGDARFFVDLLRHFVRDYGGGLVALTDGEDADERGALMASVHKLRGSSSMLGATTVHEIASRLETRLGEGDERPAVGPDGATDVAALLASLNEALRQLGAAAAATLANSATPPSTEGNMSGTQPTTHPVSAATLQAIQALRRLLDQQDFAAIESLENLSTDLLPLMGSQALASLSDAVHSLEFATAAHMLAGAFPVAASNFSV
ncbi:MAG: response regulator, partial [Burkholderiaceae bacterium]|nr:response regulator [Burkholderiaceae bacterium]